MEKKEQDCSGWLSSMESLIVPSNNDEPNDLNSHDFYRDLANNYLISRNNEFKGKLLECVNGGSSLALAYSYYVRYVMASCTLIDYSDNKNIANAKSYLESAILDVIDVVSKYSKCVYKSAELFVDTFRTREEWDLYYMHLLPLVLDGNVNTLDLFYEVSYQSSIARMWI